MEFVNRIRDLMIHEGANHKPYDKMTKQEFKVFHKNNFKMMNEWQLKRIHKFIDEMKKLLPDGLVKIKKNDNGIKLSDLDNTKILDAYSFNQNRPKAYLMSASDMGKEVYPDAFFQNALDWLDDNAPKQVAKHMENINDKMVSEQDAAEAKGTLPYDSKIIGDYDDLEDEGFFKKYPHLK